MTGPDLTMGHEGCRLEAYQDGGGIWTIGWGHTGPEVHEGLVWTQGQADAAFATDYATAERNASRIWMIAPVWDSLGPIRCAALCDMSFNLGAGGLNRFVKMLTSMRSQQWQAAHDAGLDSLWARQLPRRAGRVMGMILSNSWPE